jgi:hypothetical protein
MGAACRRCGRLPRAGAPQRQHMAAFQPVLAAAVDGDDLVLAGGAVPRRRPTPCGRRSVLGRRVRHIGRQVAGGTGDSRSPTPASWPALVHHEGGRAPRRPCRRRRLAAGAHEIGRADVAGLVAQHLAVSAGRAAACLAEQRKSRARRPGRRARRRFTARDDHAAFLRGHDARRARQLVGVEDHGFVQERARSGAAGWRRWRRWPAVRCARAATA